MVAPLQENVMTWAVQVSDSTLSWSFVRTKAGIEMRTSLTGGIVTKYTFGTNALNMLQYALAWILRVGGPKSFLLNILQ